MIGTSKEFGDKVAIKLFEILKTNDSPLTNGQIYSQIAQALSLTNNDKSKKYKSGAYIYQNHAQFGLLGLKVMGLVDHVSRGKWSISKKGKAKETLSVSEYSDFQREYWNKVMASKRKANLKKDSDYLQKGLFSKKLSQSKKEEMLSKILEQNKRILDYIMEDAE